MPRQLLTSAAARWRQVLALAAGGASIVAANFGSLITVRLAYATHTVRCAVRRGVTCPLPARVQSLYTFGLVLGTLYSVPPFRLKVCAQRCARSVGLCSCLIIAGAFCSASRCPRL
jgi:hypothetical protein